MMFRFYYSHDGHRWYFVGGYDNLDVAFMAAKSFAALHGARFAKVHGAGDWPIWEITL